MELPQIISITLSTIVGIVVSIIGFWTKRYISKADKNTEVMFNKIQSLEIKSNTNFSEVSRLNGIIEMTEKRIDREVRTRDERLGRHGDEIIELTEKIAIAQTQINMIK